jgi:hypothetical protein
MTIRGIAARPERNSQGLWISVSCGVSVTACVVACALYLASDESSILTGTEIVVGGGNILLGPQLENLDRG